MPLTAAQVTAFFEGADQMAIPHATVVQLQNEGIDTPGDLAEFDKDTLKQVAENLRRPRDRIPNPDPNAAAGSTIPRPPYIFSAKSQKRLLSACDLIRFYNTIGRGLTAGNIRWDPIIKNFNDQWTALKDRQEDDSPDVPKISRSLPIIKWTEAFDDYLHRIVGVRNIPLAYVTRSSVDVPAACPDLENNKPHSAQFGSVEGDLVARASHAHPLYRDDNAKVYYDLEEATRSTPYAASIKPFQRAKNGRGALESLRRQYAGVDKWETELKRQDDLLHTRVWKGQSNFSLEKFVQQHRNAYVSMQQCAEHVAFQLPNEHTRVGYLLEAIQTTDAGLQAAIAQIKTDDGANGKRNDFEAAASYLLPYDPVAKKRNQTKRPHADVSDTSGAEVAAFGTKPGIGKTGVHLRYYKTAEYKKLTSEQKVELKEWRDSIKDKKKSNHGQDKAIAAAVEKAVEKRLAARTPDEEKTPSKEEAKAAIMSIFQDDDDEPPAKKAKADVSSSTLKAILRRVKNGSASH